MEKILQKLREKIDEHENEFLFSEIGIQYSLLENKYISQSSIKEYHQLFDSLRTIFANDNNVYAKHMVKDFNAIEKILKYYSMSVKERFKIWIYLINYNLIRDILLSEKCTLDYSKLKNIDMPQFVKDKIVELVLTDKMSDLLEKMKEAIADDKTLHLEKLNVSKQDVAVIRELYKHLEELCENDDQVVESHRNIKEHYIDKVDNYDENDVEIIVNAFMSLGISTDESQMIKFILLKDISKRKQDEKEVNCKKNHQPVEQKKLLTKKDYRELLGRLKNYFDIDTHKVSHELSMEEIIECTKIMLELGFEIKDIKNYLKIIEQHQSKNPIVRYINNSEKLKFYATKQCYQPELETLQDYFGEIFICSDEDYIFWKQSIESELEKINKLVPWSYEYEIDKARTK